MSLIPANYVNLIFALTGLVITVSSFVFGSIAYSVLVVGLIFIVVSCLTKGKFALNILSLRLAALIWTILSIFTAFIPYLFNLVENKNLLWVLIGLSLFNLLTILFSTLETKEE
ncbi:MAG: hypothetical protein OHK0017_00100 [Patescibacteria group bacterium]